MSPLEMIEACAKVFGGLSEAHLRRMGRFYFTNIYVALLYNIQSVHHLTQHWTKTYFILDCGLSAALQKKVGFCPRRI